MSPVFEQRPILTQSFCVLQIKGSGAYFKKIYDLDSSQGTSDKNMLVICITTRLGRPRAEVTCAKNASASTKEAMRLITKCVNELPDAAIRTFYKRLGGKLDGIKHHKKRIMEVATSLLLFLYRCNAPSCAVLSSSYAFAALLSSRT